MATWPFASATKLWNIASYLKSYMVTLSRILTHLGILPHPLDPLPKAYQTLPNGDALARARGWMWFKVRGSI